MLFLDIHKQLDGFMLDLTLDAPEEKIIVLFGASGAGKSLTLAAIAGLITPDAGRIAIGERVLFDAARRVNVPPQARQIGMVRQDLALFPHLSAEDNIAYGLEKLSRTERKQRVHELVMLTQLEGFVHRKPAALSGGQQQRVALARALARHPALLLLDEPFSALDYPVRVELRHELRALQQRLKTSMLFVTHDLGEANLLADAMAVLDQGRVIQCAPPAAILRAPATRRVAEIIGIKNILPATVVAARTLRVGTRELEADTNGFAVGAQVWMCLRAERVMLVRADALTRPIANALEGDLIHEDSDGNHVLFQFRARDRRLNPTQSFDLWIDTPVYVYERLNLARERHWLVSLKSQAIHLVAE